MPIPDIDPECLDLCSVLNLFPGAATFSCCSGHGNEPLNVAFWAPEDIARRIFDALTEDWTMTVASMDPEKKRRAYVLWTVKVGPRAFVAAKMLCEDLLWSALRRKPYFPSSEGEDPFPFMKGTEPVTFGD